MSGTTKKHPTPSAVQSPTTVDGSAASPFCCCGRRSVKVKPDKGTYPGFDILEVRPGRHLRIMHLNPRKREDRFQAEMERYMKAQINSGKYNTKGKMWSLPQPGRMDKSESFKQYQQQGGANLPLGQYGNKVSYQACDDDTGTYCPNQHGEDNLSFCADSPEPPNKRRHVRAQLSNESRTSSIHERSPHIGENGGVDLGNGWAPNSSAAVSWISCLNQISDGGTSHGGAGNGDRQHVTSTSAVNTRASTATSVVLQVKENGGVDSGPTPATNGGPLSASRQPSSQLTSKPSASSPPAAKASPPSDPAREQTVVFFIHGVGGSSAVWQAQADYFMQKGYEVVLPELIGHGFSSAPSSPSAYTFGEIACDLLVIFDLYCKRKNMVVGHSYGSSFAAVLARQRPRLVTQMVLVSGGSPTPLAPQPGTFSAPTWLLACCKPILNRGFRRSAFYDKKSHALMARAFDVPTYVLKYTMNGQMWLEGGEDYHSWLTPPALLIHGRQDKLVTLEEQREMERVISGSILEVIEGASHMVMMEQPELVNSLLYRFLLGHLRPASASQAVSEVDIRSIGASRASIRSNKSVPSGLVAGNLK